VHARHPEEAPHHQRGLGHGQVVLERPLEEGQYGHRSPVSGPVRMAATTRMACVVVMTSPVLLLHTHRPEAKGDDSGGDVAHYGDAEQQAQREGWGEGLVRAEGAGEDLLLDQSLSPLNQARW
jgi:hypothetical protein